MACTESISIAETLPCQQARRMARARLVEGLLRVSTPSLSESEIRAALEELVVHLRLDLEELAHVEGAKNG
jgi:hypothetical protein